MVMVKYEIVQHDGGWAYKVGDVLSETFRSHDAALKAARKAQARAERALEKRTAALESVKRELKQARRELAAAHRLTYESSTPGIRRTPSSRAAVCAAGTPAVVS